MKDTRFMQSRTTRISAAAVALAATGSIAFAAPPVPRGGQVTPPPDLGDIKTAPSVKPVKTPIDPERAAALAQPQPQLIGPPLPPKPAPQATGAHAIDFSHVMYDQPGDGSLWARGATYKAQFAADGFTYVPFLGSDAPRNFPVKMTLQGIDAGGKALSFAADAAPVRQGDRVVFDRGLVQEVYLLTPNSIEQEFIFNARPGQGDVTIRLSVDSDLAADDLNGSLQFANELGGVKYSNAVTIDAASRSVDSPTRLVDGRAIEIVLTDALVSGAAYPITVDPIISTYTPASSVGSTLDRTPDIAYDATNDGYGIVWEYQFSATDGDIYCERLSYGGTTVAGSFVYIDVSTTNWRRPRIANNNANDEYLVVAEVGAVGSRQVWSRTRSASSNTIGSQTQVSDGVGFSGDQFNPDVGGDPWLGGGAVYYCVVWERTFSSTDEDIFARLVVPVTGAVSGGVILIENSGSTIYSHPAISNSDNSFTWNVVYQFTASSNDEDIYGTQLDYAGSIITSNFGIDTSLVNNTNPAVSGSVGGNYMTVYEEDPAGQGDIYARLYTGSTFVAGGNLTLLENILTAIPRRLPTIDSNADHFFVAYDQRFTSLDWDPYVSVYCYTSGLGIRVAEQHRNLDYTGLDTVDVKIASSYSSAGSFPTEFMPVWDMRGTIGGEVHGSYAFARNSCCKTDITNDGTTGVADLLGVISGWGPCSDYSICPADINGDFAANVADLLSVISAWGPCP